MQPLLPRLRGGIDLFNAVQDVVVLARSLRLGEAPVLKQSQVPQPGPVGEGASGTHNATFQAGAEESGAAMGHTELTVKSHLCDDSVQSISACLRGKAGIQDKKGTPSGQQRVCSLFRVDRRRAHQFRLHHAQGH